MTAAAMFHRLFGASDDQDDLQQIALVVDAAGSCAIGCGVLPSGEAAAPFSKRLRIGKDGC
jgi:predicted dinucleotide-binding enzyme